MNAEKSDRRDWINGKVVILKRADLSRSLRELARAWRWDHSTVRRFLHRLEQMEIVRINNETGVTLISLCNYNKIRVDDHPDCEAKKQFAYSGTTGLLLPRQKALG